MKFYAFWGMVIVIAYFFVYWVFFRPIGPEIYFKYNTPQTHYENGTVTYYLVNSNPENKYGSYFFRVTIKPKAEFSKTCDLQDFNWALIRKDDKALMFSTFSKKGLVPSESYFLNKMDGNTFKGISGDGSLGTQDFTVVLKVYPENGCGFTSDTSTFSKDLLLRQTRETIWSTIAGI